MQRGQIGLARLPGGSVSGRTMGFRERSHSLYVVMQLRSLTTTPSCPNLMLLAYCYDCSLVCGMTGIMTVD